MTVAHSVRAMAHVMASHSGKHLDILLDQKMASGWAVTMDSQMAFHWAFHWGAHLEKHWAMQEARRWALLDREHIQGECSKVGNLARRNEVVREVHLQQSEERPVQGRGFRSELYLVRTSGRNLVKRPVLNSVETKVLQMVMR